MASPYKSFINLDQIYLRYLACEKLHRLEAHRGPLCIKRLSFPDSGLNLFNGFGFYFRWRDSEKQLYVFLVQKANMTS